jgi:hypothetical protein
MAADQEMWTPLEAALAPFKELARLNRQSVTDAAGHDVQLVLHADRCHVLQGSAADPASASIEIGFSLEGHAYAVRLMGTNYRGSERWDFGRIRSDISTSLQSGALTPGATFDLAPPA